jgi:hypothetical protein
MIGVGVRTQYQAGVRDLAGTKRRFHQSRMTGAERVGKIWIDIKDAVAVFQDKAAVAEPPEGRRLTPRVIDLLE